MRYFSTRGAEDSLSFEDTVLTGLAHNGGLFIPESIPQLPANWETDWPSLSFQQLSVEVLSLYISPSEISRAELTDLVSKSYSTFRHPEVTPLVPLDDNTYILELFHGPTYAFKDVALQLLGNLFEFFLARRNARKASAAPRERLTVLGATSGDTGSAAIYGLRGKADIDIFILHPKGRVSPIQEAQMTTVPDANVHNLAVKGTFDDCQDIVKQLFADRAFNDAHRLGAINSINWARILAQTVYYFLSYFAARKQLPPDSSLQLQYVVPTGNFGDILAGYYARRMGLPVARLAIATNSNDILARFWATGRYEKVAAPTSPSTDAPNVAPTEGASDGKQATQDASGVKETLSPAMDILVSSNFERLLWYLAFEARGGDVQAACADVKGWMDGVKKDGRAVVPTSVLELARRDFVAERVSDEQTTETIASVYASAKYVADPHTAVALAAAKRIASKGVRQIVLSTAHPAKFSDAVTQALSNISSFDFERDVLPDEFKGLLEKPRRVVDIAAPDGELVKSAIVQTLAAKEKDAHSVAAAASV